MLRLRAGQVDVLWEALLPEGARVLPADLGRLDEFLCDPGLLAPFRAHWEARCPRALHEGRPTIPMASYLRLMVIKHRCGWGYQTLVREVADSFHLRRFCLISLTADVPDESTVRKLTRRLGPEVVDELIRGVIRIAVRERRFRVRAMRTDSTVVDADVRYPTDAGLASTGVRLLARAGRTLLEVAGEGVGRVRNRSRAVGLRMREMTRTLRRRTGQAKDEVLRFTAEAGALLEASIREARRAVAQVRAGARGRGARGKLAAAVRVEALIALAAKVADQIRQRVRGEKITGRLVSFTDPEARPVRKGKIAQPTQFGYVTQIAELTAATKRGARGLILPPKTKAGSVHENTLLPDTVAELEALGLRPKEAVFDAGFGPDATRRALSGLGTEVFVVGARTNRGSRRTRRRLARYRVGSEGRIAHLKREYGAKRSRLRGEEGAQIWEGWSALAYDIDTVARMPQTTRARGKGPGP